MEKHSISDSWIAGNEAVALWSLFCARQHWPWLDNDGRTDFGKDGYVDLATSDGDVRGECFAVQIKGGVSRWGTAGYRIDADATKRARWARSTLPVIAVALDPSDEIFYWIDLTASLRNAPDEPILVPRSNSLGSAAGIEQFVRYAETVTHDFRYLLDLVSAGEEQQISAVAFAYFVGRTDGRSLVMLRRLLATLQPEAFHFAVFKLAQAAHHPDFFITKDSWVSEPARRLLRSAFDWSADEVVRLVHLIDEDGIQRGSFGQNVFHLLVDAPAGRTRVSDGLRRACSLCELEAAYQLLLIELYLAAEEGPKRLSELRRELPTLNDLDEIEMLEEHLMDWKTVEFF